MKGSKFSKFLGRQLSRLKAGNSYYTIITSTISAISLLSLVFVIPFWMWWLIFPIFLFGALFIGYLLDKWDVNTMDHQKTIEMTYRYLTIQDFKNNDFRMMMMEVFFEWIKSIKENKDLDESLLKEKYKAFLDKWSPK